MKKNNFFLNYSKNGYFITKPLINYKELCNLREDLDEELNIWLKQIKIIKKIDKDFGEKMDQILMPVKKKYL